MSVRFFPGNRLLILGFVLMISVAALAISHSNESPSSENGSFTYTLPEGWEVFERTLLSDERESISIVTDISTMVSIETGGCGPDIGIASISHCLKRYVNASLVLPEQRDSAVIDMGEVDRVGHQGLFAKVVVSGGHDVSYVIEVFRFQHEKGFAFLIFNTPEEYAVELSDSISMFISSIN